MENLRVPITTTSLTILIFIMTTGDAIVPVLPHRGIFAKHEESLMNRERYLPESRRDQTDSMVLQRAPGIRMEMESFISQSRIGWQEDEMVEQSRSVTLEKEGTRHVHPFGKKKKPLGIGFFVSSCRQQWTSTGCSRLSSFYRGKNIVDSPDTTAVDPSSG